MLSDLRIACRTLCKAPVFTLTAIIALALGVAANTAIFSVVNALLWNPAGIREVDRLVAIRVKYDKLSLKNISASARDFADIRESKGVFASAAMSGYGDFNYTGVDTPERLRGEPVTWQWFDVFGVKPELGRAFRPEEDQPNANHVVVLAHAAWMRLFGGDRNILGKSIQLNEEPYTVIGVIGADFRWPSQADLWVPIGLPASDYTPQMRFNESYFAVARIKPDIPFGQADAFVKTLTQQIVNQVGYARSSGWGMFAVPLAEFVAGDLKKPALVLLGAVGFVLLIACSNIAGLMLARVSGRAREIAIRAALGAGRWRLIRQTLTESLLLALCGTSLGFVLARGGVRLLLLLAPENMGGSLVIRVDATVLLFTAAAGVLSALVFGLAPAWHAVRAGQQEALKEGGRSGTASRNRQRLRGALVVGEVSLALILLVGAGLFLRSLARLQRVDTGFQPQGVMTASLSLPRVRYKDADTMCAFYRAVTERLASQPGVTAAAAAVSLPFSNNASSASFQIEGRPAGPGDPGPHGDVRYITPGYFACLRIPLRKGRYFTSADRKGSEPVAVIDENLARQYWPNEDPIGRRIRRGNRAPWSTIVGVAGHIRHSDLAGDTGKGVYYYSLYQVPIPMASLLVRTPADPARLAPVIREAVRAADPTQPLFDVKTMEQRVAESLRPREFAVILLGVFAGMALLLAALGLYGVISYSVTQRTQEIGIRMALGATRFEVLGLVIGQGMRLATAGMLIGLFSAFLLAKLVKSQLFEVSAFEPVTFALTAAILGATALAATYFPARRAARVDPIVALRYE